MKRRAIRFILALSALAVLIWFIGEILIGIFINNYWVSVGWGIFCLVAALVYSGWKCPREPIEDDDEDDTE